jgi:hypothetical protein
MNKTPSISGTTTSMHPKTPLPEGAPSSRICLLIIQISLNKIQIRYSVLVKPINEVNVKAFPSV